MTQTHVLSRAVIISDGHILLDYDPRPKPFHYYKLNESFYYLPGGHVDHKESVRDAVIREIQEETGHVGCIEKFLGVLEHSFDGDQSVVCHTHEVNFIFKVNIPDLRAHTPIAEQEEDAFAWIKIEDIQNIDIRPSSLKVLLLKWLNENMNPTLESEGF